MTNKAGHDPYARLNLREQLYLEARAMAEFALANGYKVSPAVITTVEKYEVKVFHEDGGEADVTVRDDIAIKELVDAHAELVKLVEPAKPSTILLLDMEQKSEGRFKFLGPVSLIRQMMVAAIISLAMFVLLGLSSEVNSDGGNILASDGLPLLLNLLFFLSAAGLGASFSALYKANYYITKGTFDPTYHASYWIRFFLGLIAGLILSVLISEDAFTGLEGSTSVLEEGIIRPLLAILGGFSADLAYTVLSRLVETVESLFRGSTKMQIDAQIQDEKSRASSAQNLQQMKMASDLLALQQMLNSNMNPSEMNAEIKRMIGEVMPGSSALPDREG